jgi:predicted nucleic acid-binding Zn ribbon protein
MGRDPNREETAAAECHAPASWSAEQVEEVVVHARLGLYNRGMPCGPRVLREHIEEVFGVRSSPSERTIARMLARNGLTHRRTGWYPGEHRESGASEETTSVESTERR